MSEAATVTLTNFLLARLAEDEERASWHHRLLCLRTACDNEGCIWGPDEQDAMQRERVCNCGYPDRIRADVEAKRAIVRQVINLDLFDGYTEATRDAVTALAGAYRDHPDYREDWRP